MHQSVIVHIVGEEPIEGQIEELPQPHATFLMLKHPQKKGGRDLGWLHYHTTMLLISFAQISSVEIINEPNLVLKSDDNQSQA